MGPNCAAVVAFGPWFRARIVEWFGRRGDLRGSVWEMATGHDPEPKLSAADAAAAYSLASDIEFEVVGRLAGGENGATEIRSADGTRRVLKWEANPLNITSRIEGARLAERLRSEAGWPVPTQHVVHAGNWLFVAQQFMRGDAVTRLSEPMVGDLLTLHQSRRGLEPDDSECRWGVDQIEILVSGGRGYCLHEPLRSYDKRTRRVVERIESIGRELVPDQLAGNDIVHADLHPGNFLQTDGRIAAVVDLDYARTGDAAFDLAFLAVFSMAYRCDQTVRDYLVAVGLDSLDPARRQAYVGNLLLRLLDWPIRKNRTEEIEFWLPKADWLFDGS